MVLGKVRMIIVGAQCTKYTNNYGVEGFEGRKSARLIQLQGLPCISIAYANREKLLAMKK